MYVCTYSSLMEKGAHTLALLMRPNVVERLVRSPAQAPISFISVVKPDYIIILNLLSHFYSIHSQPRLRSSQQSISICIQKTGMKQKANDRFSSLRTPYLNYPTFSINHSRVKTSKPSSLQVLGTVSMYGVVLSKPKSPLPLLAAFESGLACKLRCQSPTSANFPQGVGQRDGRSTSFVGPTVAKPAQIPLRQFMFRAAMLTCLYWAKLSTALMQHYSAFRNLLISPSLQP